MLCAWALSSRRLVPNASHPRPNEDWTSPALGFFTMNVGALNERRRTCGQSICLIFVEVVRSLRSSTIPCRFRSGAFPCLVRPGVRRCSLALEVFLALEIGAYIPAPGNTQSLFSSKPLPSQLPVLSSNRHHNAKSSIPRL